MKQRMWLHCTQNYCDCFPVNSTMKVSPVDYSSLVPVSLLFTYLFLDSPPPRLGAVGAADDGWGLVVILLLLVRTHLHSRSSAVRLVTAGGFLHH